MEDAVIRYIESFIRPPLLLEELDREYDTRSGIQPSIGPITGAVLRWLVLALPVRQALEFGTCLGYSTIILANALRQTGGHLTAVELRHDLVEETRHNLSQAGLTDVVTLIEGDAAAVLPALPGPFDLILQDSDKALYTRLLEDCLEKLRPGGVLAADDTLFLPMGIPEKFSQPVDGYNRRVFSDPRLESVILPVGDGLTLSWKRP